ncbi:MAG: helix-turn-helix domain-containing protein [Gammaproteobacteria bacterium]|nr:MAG: helix-turn-helix domain-containing protein [Gammaproteobacteria bacterium]
MPADGVPDDAAGARLKAAREARGLAIEQIADALHLDEAVIVALEASRFAELGAPVFVRGHLRAYARYLALPEEELLAAVASEPPPPPPPARAGARPALNLQPAFWAMGLFGLLLAAGLAWYVLRDFGSERPPPVAISAPAPAKAIPVPRSGGLPRNPSGSAAGAAPATAAPAQPAEPEPGPEPVEPPVTAADTAAAAPPAAASGRPEVTLELAFAEDSWTEISDRNGRLLFGLQRGGTRRRLSGEPPFSLLLGNAPAVEISVAGEPWPLPARRGGARVARLTIDPAEGGP